MRATNTGPPIEACSYSPSTHSFVCASLENCGGCPPICATRKAPHCQAPASLADSDISVAGSPSDRRRDWVAAAQRNPAPPTRWTLDGRPTPNWPALPIAAAGQPVGQFAGLRGENTRQSPWPLINRRPGSISLADPRAARGPGQALGACRVGFTPSVPSTRHLYPACMEEIDAQEGLRDGRNLTGRVVIKLLSELLPLGMKALPSPAGPPPPRAPSPPRTYVSAHDRAVRAQEIGQRRWHGVCDDPGPPLLPLPYRYRAWCARSSRVGGPWPARSGYEQTRRDRASESCTRLHPRSSSSMQHRAKTSGLHANGVADPPQRAPLPPRGQRRMSVSYSTV
ncbi:hypothetical protein MRB53_039101 [Persea americana]|nr:hypothetical protein MRB53_039101 [Persea americana]